MIDLFFMENKKQNTKYTRVARVCDAKYIINI